MSDGQLLERFVTWREEAALETLVQRHGSMVLSVCRRILRDHHDAEDAFQATFLVLARRAASIMPREKVGNWLYGVAYQTAMKARATRAKRRMRESPATESSEPEAAAGVQKNELVELLDHELSRLPDKYRSPIVLCELEGKSHGEAAERLGWPIGTVSGRLSRGRAMLAKRLTQRGVAPTAGSLILLAENLGMASASVPSGWVSSTVKAATLFAAGGAVTEGIVSSEVVILTGKVLKTMMFSKIKFTLTALLAFTLAGVGLWQASSWAGGTKPASGTFHVTVNEVLHEDTTVVTQVGIEAPPGSTIELLSDDKRNKKTLSAELAKQPDGVSRMQLTILGDLVEMKDASASAVKFVLFYKLGKVTGCVSETEKVPVNTKPGAELLADMLSLPIKAGDYQFGEGIKMVTFQGKVFTLVVNKPQ